MAARGAEIASDHNVSPLPKPKVSVYFATRADLMALWTRIRRQQPRGETVERVNHEPGDAPGKHRYLRITSNRSLFFFCRQNIATCGRMDATNRNFVEVEDVAVPDLGMAEGIWYGTTRKMQIEVETVSGQKNKPTGLRPWA
jgi:hypothetical protein